MNQTDIIKENKQCPFCGSEIRIAETLYRESGEVPDDVIGALLCAYAEEYPLVNPFKVMSGLAVQKMQYLIVAYDYCGECLRKYPIAIGKREGYVQVNMQATGLPNRNSGSENRAQG